MTPGPDDRGRVPAHTVRMFTDDLLEIAHRQVYASIFSKGLAIPGEPSVQAAGSANRANACALRPVIGVPEDGGRYAIVEQATIGRAGIR